jgi:glycosyltransferase involved in cell wall biosynthesis
VLYLTLRIIFLLLSDSSRTKETREDGSPINTTSLQNVIVVDVLPTPLPFLSQFTSSSLLYYCHFPDKLLKQRNKNDSNAAEQLLSQWEAEAAAPARPKALLLTHLYRSVMNAFEAWGMRAADTIAVNSSYTRTVTLESFPFLQRSRGRCNNNDDDDAAARAAALPVLYPALDASSLDAWRQSAESATTPGLSHAKQLNRVVSLNRYERKKDLGLLLKAMDWVRHQRDRNRGSAASQSYGEPEIIVAGGYDTQNAENVEHLEELRSLASELGLTVDFRCSVSDAERAELLHTALVVVYTPSHEHFGIVPLEAMYSGTALVTVNNGGPTESVLNGRTGFLCENTPAAFGGAILRLLEDPDLAVEMGRAGRRHVIERFGEGRLKAEWKALVERTIATGEQRRRRSSRFLPVTVLIATLLLVASWLLSLYGYAD